MSYSSSLSTRLLLCVYLVITDIRCTQWREEVTLLSIPFMLCVFFTHISLPPLMGRWEKGISLCYKYNKQAKEDARCGGGKPPHLYPLTKEHRLTVPLFEGSNIISFHHFLLLHLFLWNRKRHCLPSSLAKFSILKKTAQRAPPHPVPSYWLTSFCEIPRISHAREYRSHRPMRQKEGKEKIWHTLLRDNHFPVFQ